MGNPVDRPTYRFSDHSRSAATVRLEPRDWVLIEGLYTLYWSSLCDMMEFRIFIVVDDAVCLARRLRRDTLERGRTAASVEEQYAGTVRPMFERFVRPTVNHAQLILDGTQAPDDQLRICESHLTGHIAG